MKKTLILLVSISLILSIGLMSYNKYINQNLSHNKNIELKDHFKRKFKNTEVTAYCENGKNIYKGNYKDGKKNGKWITYYKKERIKSKGDYKNGKKDGEWVIYKKDGGIKSKEKYEDGIRY